MTSVYKLLALWRACGCLCAYFIRLKAALRRRPYHFPLCVDTYFYHVLRRNVFPSIPFFGVHVGVEILSLPPTYFRVCVCVWRGVPFLIPFLCAFSIAFYLPPPCACVSMPRPWKVMKVTIISYLLHSYCTWHCTLQ